VRTLINGLMIAALSKVLADELKEWMAWLPAKMIRWAARHLPKNLGERFEEEWLAHCNDLPGNCAKLWHATGCVIVYIRCTRAVEKAAWWTLIYPIVEFSFCLYFVKVFLLEAAGITYLHRFHPEIVRLRRLRRQAGGLSVLGITDLELRTEDYAPGKLQRALSESIFFVNAQKVLFPAFAADYVEGRFRLAHRVINRLFWD